MPATVFCCFTNNWVLELGCVFCPLVLYHLSQSVAEYGLINFSPYIECKRIRACLSGLNFDLLATTGLSLGSLLELQPSTDKTHSNAMALFLRISPVGNLKRMNLFYVAACTVPVIPKNDD